MGDVLAFVILSIVALAIVALATWLVDKFNKPGGPWPWGW